MTLVSWLAPGAGSSNGLHRKRSRDVNELPGEEAYAFCRQRGANDQRCNQRQIYMRNRSDPPRHGLLNVRIAASSANDELAGRVDRYDRNRYEESTFGEEGPRVGVVVPTLLQKGGAVAYIPVPPPEGRGY